MNRDTLRELLLWSLVINYGVLLIWFAAFTLAHDRLYRLHSRWFQLSRETFDGCTTAACRSTRSARCC
jgi:hypothetical protein